MCVFPGCGATSKIIQIQWSRDTVTNLCQTHVSANPITLAVCQDWRCWERRLLHGGVRGGGGWPLWQDRHCSLRLRISACVCVDGGIDIPLPRVHRSRLKRLINFHSVMGCEEKKKEKVQSPVNAVQGQYTPSYYTHTNTLKHTQKRAHAPWK